MPPRIRGPFFPPRWKRDKYDPVILSRAKPVQPPEEYEPSEEKILLNKDCPIFNIRPLHRAKQVQGVGTFIFEGGVAEAKILVPEKFRGYILIHPHARSTFARLCLEITLSQLELQKMLREPLDSLTVIILNWGRYPFLLRDGDAIALSNFLHAIAKPNVFPQTKPRTTRYGSLVDLHAGDTYSEIIEKNLPTISIPEIGTIRFVDPREDIEKYTRTKKFKRLKLMTEDFIVISTKEYIRIPPDHFGLVHSVHDELQHSSAILVYPEWEGHLALEFRVWQKSPSLPVSILRP